MTGHRSSCTLGLPPRILLLAAWTRWPADNSVTTKQDKAGEHLASAAFSAAEWLWTLPTVQQPVAELPLDDVAWLLPGCLQVLQVDNVLKAF